MSNDLLITPASRKLDFKDSSGNVDATIETDASGNLIITNTGGDISIGDTTSDIFIGDGTNNIDIVFEQSGEIRGLTGVTVTLGASDSNIRMATDLNLNSNDITNASAITSSGVITASGGNSGNWNTAHGWGNHASQSYITNSTASLDASKITSGLLGGARIATGTSGDWWSGNAVKVGTDGVMEVGKYIDFHNTDAGTSDYTARLTNTGDHLYATGRLYANNTQRVFADDYHPNADTWTTARTITLGGDLTGNVSINGSANVTLTAAVVNDSHNHNHSDGNFTVNGVLQAGAGSNHISTAAAPFRWQRSTSSQTGQNDNVSVYVDDSNIYFTHNNDDDADASGYHFRYMTGGTATNLLNFSSSTMTYKGQTVFHTGYHPNADTLTTARTIAGTSFNGSANIAISYNNLTNKPTIPSLSGYATESYVGTQISNLVDSSPAALNTLNELAAAIGDDASFSTTITNSIATKLPLAGGTMTGTLNMGGNAFTGNNFNISGVNQISLNDPGEGIVFGANCNLYLLDDAADNILRLDAPGGFRLHNGPLSIGTTTVIDSSRNLTNIGTISSGALTATTTVDATPALFVRNTGGVGSVIAKFMGDTDGLEIQCGLGGNSGAGTGDYAILNTQQDNGLVFFDGAGGVDVLYNGVVVQSWDSAGGTRLISGTLQIPTKLEHVGDTDTYLQFDDNRIRLFAGGTAKFDSNNTYLTSHQSLTSLMPKAGGTFTGGVTISGSVNSGGSNMGFYESGGTNLILKGDSVGRSGIFFESEKDGTNINHPTDYGFIQFHSYGYGGTSGESADLVIGVSNDSTDQVIIQSPYNGGVKVGYKDATSGTGLTTQTVFHDAYHPNADKWTTARTLTLSGEVTGSVSFDGSGAINMTNTVLDHGAYYLGVTTAETGRTVKESGLYTYNVYNNNLGTGTETAYYSVMSWGAGTAGSAQLASKWTSNWDKLYFRSLRDTTNNWSDWREIYHTSHKPTYTELGTMAYSNLTGTPTIPSISGLAPIADPTFTGDLNMPNKLRHDGDTNTYIQFHAADQFRVVTGGGERLEVNNTNTTVANRLLSTYSGTSAHTLQNATSNGTVLTLTSTGDNRVLSLQTDHIFSNGTMVFGDNSHVTYYRGSTHNFEGGSVDIESKLRHRGDTDNYINFSAADTQSFVTGNSTRFQITNSLVRFNQEGVGQDFQVYGANDNNLIFADASVDKVGIGTSAPISKLVVLDSTFPQVRINDETNGGESGIRFRSKGTGVDLHGDIFVDGTGGETGRMGFRIPWNTTEKMTILHSGNVGIGTTSPSEKLHIHSGGVYSTPISYAANADGWGLKLGASNNAGWDHLGIKLRVDSTGSPRMALMSTGSVETISIWGGKVGVGVIAPSQKLDVGGIIQAAGALRVTETGTAQVIMIGNQDSGGVNTPAMIMGVNGAIRIGHGSSWSGEGGTFTEKIAISGSSLKITSGGLILNATTVIDSSRNLTSIGNLTFDDGHDIINVRHVRLDPGAGNALKFWDSTSYQITMASQGTSTYGRVAGESTSDYNMYFRMGGGTNRGFVFQNGNSGNNVAGIDSLGNARFKADVIAYTSSDKRLKDNITRISNPMEKINKLSGNTFEWNDNQDTYEKGMKDVGVIAQEVEEVLPEIVETRDNGYKAVKYEKMVALLIEGMKEQQEQIEKLEKQIQELKEE